MTEASPDNPRLQQALAAGDLGLVRAATRDTTVSLDDALWILVLICSNEHEHYPRAAVRWIARICREHPTLDLEDLDHVQAALRQMPSDPAGALELLQALGVPGASAAAR